MGPHSPQANTQNQHLDEYTKRQLITLLSQIGDLAQALELAHPLGLQFPLIDLSAQPIAEEQEDFAWETIESISVRTIQASAMVAVAQQYQL